MKHLPSLIPHALALVLASGAAYAMWTRAPESAQAAKGDVTVWPGRAADVTSVSFDGGGVKTTLLAKSDAVGGYFIGTVERSAAAAVPQPPTPGAPSGPSGPTSSTFTSVDAAIKLAASLAPLRALRQLGTVEASREAEFGLDKPDGTLTVSLGQVTQELTIGGPTVGGTDRYARSPSTGQVYVIDGGIVAQLSRPEARLLERDLHGWADGDVTEARIEAGDKRRDAARGGADAKRFWADAARPGENDETLGNWMAKLDRLRPTEYAATLPAGTALALRVEYSGAARGFLELYKAPGDADKADYYVRTERTRSYAKVATMLGSGVAEDVAGIVR